LRLNPALLGLGDDLTDPGFEVARERLEGLAVSELAKPAKHHVAAGCKCAGLPARHECSCDSRTRICDRGIRHRRACLPGAAWQFCLFRLCDVSGRGVAPRRQKVLGERAQRRLSRV
jgi:hypothetical protein